MKILYVSLGLGVCGGVRILAEHCNRLSQRGHDVTMVALSGETELTWMPCDFRMIPLKDLGTFAKDMDVVVATEANTMPIVAEMETGAEKFNFIQMRESLFHLHGDLPWASMVEWHYRTMKDVLKPLVISQWLKRFLEDDYGYEDVPIVPNGVNTDMFYPDPNPKWPKGDKPRILIEGHSHGEAKDVAHMSFSVVNSYKQQMGELEVWGMSQLDAEYEFDRFFRLPPQDMVRQIYSSCDVLLKASRYEGRSCIHPESMACGTAVVTAIGTGDDDLIHGYNCLKVQYGDGQGMLNHLAGVLGQDIVRKALVENGLNYVKNSLQWGPFIDRLELIYDGGVPEPWVGYHEQ